jgi:hopene-associated glycosyltransferase HpnB
VTALVVATLACAIWVYLLTARGGFWRAAERDETAAIGAVAAWPRVTAVIPARDEALVIADNLASLLQQDYPGALAVIVVDDHSSDDTSTIARQVAASIPAVPLAVLAAPKLAPGWTGKLWALHHGIRHAESLPESPDFLLLTDADIRHAPDTVRTLVARAHADGLVLSSLMARLHCESFAERMSIPAFVFFFQMLYPFAWVNDPKRVMAAAAGGCMLVHADTLRRAGGIAAIRDELIDDCALARLVKPNGPIRLALTERACSTRTYRSFGGIRRMIVRCAFTELRFSPWRLAGATAALLVVFVAPPVIALSGPGAARMPAVIAWVCMTAAFQPMLRFHRLSPAWGLALPVIASSYLLWMLDSAWQHARGRGGEWKGRVRARTASTQAGRS